jgi:hypothetical protein
VLEPAALALKNLRNEYQKLNQFLNNCLLISKMFVRKPEDERPLGRYRVQLEYN